MNIFPDKHFKNSFLSGQVLCGCLLQLLLEHCDILNVDISQGSVALHLRRAGIFK